MHPTHLGLEITQALDKYRIDKTCHTLRTWIQIQSGSTTMCLTLDDLLY
jgi:hypothetical protein